MRTYSKLLALFTGCALALSGAGYAQSTTTKAPAATKSGKKAPTSVTRGTVKSINDNQIVIERKVNGKENDVTFNMDSSTQKQGDLKVGTPVTVHFRNEGGKDVATIVRAQTPKKTASK
jgi:hypothetical protein